MANEDKIERIIYLSSEVADILHISSSTLRKWCLALESEGYIFERGSNNSRSFHDRDIAVLRRLRELVKNRKMTLDISAKLVMTTKDEVIRTSDVREENAVHDDVPLTINDREKIDKILERLENQEQFNKELVKQLHKYDKYIEERIDNRDEQLVSAIREIQEARKLIATKEENKQKWWQFWK